LHRHLRLLIVMLLALWVGVLADVPLVQAQTAPPPAAPPTAPFNFHPEDIINTCWSCSFFAIIFDTSYQLGYYINNGDGANAGLVNRLADMSALLLALYLLWIALKLVFPFGPLGGFRQDGNNLILHMAAVVIAIAALKSHNKFYEDYFLVPAISTGVELAVGALEASTGAVGQAGNGTSYQIAAPTNNGSCPAVTTSTGTGFSLTAPAPPAHMSPKVKLARNKLICQMQNIQQAIGVGALIGVSGMIYGPQVGGLNFNPLTHFGVDEFAKSVIDKVLSVLAGLVLLVIYAIAIIVYPFYLLDAFLMLMFIGVLAGFFIFTYALRLFRQATYAAFKALVEAAAVITFLSIVVGIGMSMLAYASQQYLATYGISKPTSGAITELVAQIAAGKIWLKLYEPNYWLFVVAGFLLIRTMKDATRLAEVFTAGPGKEGYRDEFHIGVTLGEKVASRLSTQSAALGFWATRVTFTAPFKGAQAVGGFLERTRNPFGSMTAAEIAYTGAVAGNAKSFEAARAGREADLRAGNTEAAVSLGIMAEKGALKDKVQALAYYKIAAADPRNPAQARAIAEMRRLESTMAAAEIKKAEDMADAWDKDHNALPTFTPPYA
jgi:hypothetical protein